MLDTIREHTEPLPDIGPIEAVLLLIAAAVFGPVLVMWFVTGCW